MPGVDGMPSATRHRGTRTIRYAVGEVVAAAADERVFVSGRWQFDDDKLNTIHHLGTGNFVASGRHVQANTPENK